MTGVSESKQKRRERLFDEHPYCHWCGIEVIRYVHVPFKADPPNAATIDHRYGKLDSRRRNTLDKDAMSVLACVKCNRARGLEDQRRLGLDELRRRSRRWPRSVRGLPFARAVFTKLLRHRVVQLWEI